MNCPMCGGNLGENDQSCQYCGTRRSEMGPAFNNQPNTVNYGNANNYSNNAGYGQQGGYGSANYGNADNYGNTANYGQPNSYGMGYGMNAPRNSGSGFASRALMNPLGTIKKIRLITSLICILIFIGVFLYRNVFMMRDVKKDFDDFSVTFPQVLKEDKTSTFNDNDAEESAVYSNNNIAFAYVKYDMSGSDVDAETFVEYMDISLKSGLDDYDQIKLVGDKLYFYFSEDDENYYSLLTAEKKDDELYMFIGYCLKSEESKYSSQVGKMIQSIKFK